MCASPIAFLLLFIAGVQNFFMSGVLFGWASISGTLLLAPTTAGGAGLDLDYVLTMFTLSASFGCLAPIFLGIALEAGGPRFCSVLSIFIFSSGCFMFANSEPEKSPYFILSMCLMAFGGPGVHMATISTANLFTNWEGLATAFLTSSFQLSFVIFLIFHQLWAHDPSTWDYSALFRAHGTLCFSSILLSLCCWPDEPFGSHADHHHEATSTSSHHSLVSSIGGIGTGASINNLVTDSGPAGIGVGGEGEGIGCGRREGGGAKRSGSKLNLLEDPVHVHALENAPSLYRNGSNSSSSSSGSSSSRSRSNSMSNSSHFAVEHSKLFDNRGLPWVKYTRSYDVHHSLPLPDQLQSPPFLRLLGLFIMATFWANFFVGTVDYQLGAQLVPVAKGEQQQPFQQEQLGNSNEMRHRYANLFTLTLVAGVLSIPLFGFLMDREHGYVVMSSLVGLSAFLWTLLVLYDTTTSLLYSFAFYTLFRTSLFAFVFAYTGDVFGASHFAVLIGLLFVASGLVGLLTYPLGSWARGTCNDDNLSSTTDSASPIFPDSDCKKGHWQLVSLLMAFSCLYFIYFSYADWVERRRAAKIKAKVAREVRKKLNYGSVITTSKSNLSTADLEAISSSRRNSFAIIAPLAAAALERVPSIDEEGLGEKDVLDF